MATPIPANRATFTLEEICAATGGALVAGVPGDVPCVGVSTDSRALAPGGIFVALRGPSFDGHAHVGAAALSGARVVVVEDEVVAPAGLAVVRVPSTLDALGGLARAHLTRWRRGGDKTVIGITGSAGKTTTRVAIGALLETLFPGAVHATNGNLNNRVGLPMVAFGVEDSHRIALLEMGMNQPGEIAALCEIASPDVGVLVLIAAAHTELLGSIDGVSVEKAALLRALPADGVAIGNGDDVRVRSALVRASTKRRHTYGEALDADVRIVARELVGFSRSRIELERLGRQPFSFTTPLLGEAGALACAAAVAVAEIVFDAEITGQNAGRAFGEVEVGAGAGRLVPRLLADGLAIIDDSYNANPASMRASIRAAAEIATATGRRLVLVLGEMRELGADADAAHEEVGRAAAESGAEALVALAGRARGIAEAARAAGLWAEFREKNEEAVDIVLRLVHAGDLVLVKGSRGVGTESIVQALAAMHEAPATTPRRSLSSRPDSDPAPEGQA